MSVWPAAAPKTHTDPRCVDGWDAMNKPLTTPEVRVYCMRVGTGMPGSIQNSAYSLGLDA